MGNPVQMPVEQRPFARFDTARESAVEDRSLNETVQFLLPRRALAAIDPIAIIAEARRDGVCQRRIGLDDRGAGASETRLTCGFIMAVRVARAIERAEALAADRCDRALAMDLAAAKHSAVTALARACGGLSGYAAQFGRSVKFDEMFDGDAHAHHLSTSCSGSSGRQSATPSRPTPEPPNCQPAP